MADWPHQTRGVSEVLRLYNSGVPSVCLSSPTGGGKSRMVQRLCEWAVRRRMGVSVFTNRRLLTSQLCSSLNAAGIHVGVRAADFESWTDPNAPVQICSIQTELSRVYGRREEAIDLGMSESMADGMWGLHPSGLIIFDEVHQTKAQTVQTIVDEMRSKHNAFTVGVTATPLGVSHICSQLVVAGNNSELRHTGALVAAKCFEPCLFDIPKVRRSKTGLFSQKDLEDETKAIWSQHIVGHVYAHWKKINPHCLPSIGMAPGRKESLGLAMEFHKHGVNAAHICSESIFVDGKSYNTTNQEDREDLFARSKSGEIPILWNRFVLREGIDLPWLEHLILATPIASLLSYIQVCGRVLRASPSTGKRHAIISDHGGAIRLHGSPNLDRDQDWINYFYNDAHQITKDRIERLTNPENKEPEPIVCPKCKALRKSGAQCPNCGFEHDKSVRVVIQEGGVLKRMRGDYFPKRRVETRTDTERLWEKCYWQCRKAKRPMTFNQAVAWFRKKHGYEPPRDIPLMPLAVDGSNNLEMSRPIRTTPMNKLVKRAEAQPPDQNTQGSKRTTLFDLE